MDKQKQKDFINRVFDDMAATMTMGLAYLGVRTGLFAAMHEKGPMTLDAIVEASGLQHRYVKEWAGGMVATGYLDYDPAAETYDLPPEFGNYLIPELPSYLGGLYQMIPSVLATAPLVAKAFREGGGVGYEHMTEEGFEAIELQTRGLYENMLVPKWLGSVPEIESVLSGGGRALDVGSGRGRALIAMAKGYPESRFTGVDVHHGSIAAAKTEAQSAGVGERIQFIQGEVGDLPAHEKFDVITAFDVIHDLSEPLETLQCMRERLADGGTLFLMEPRVSDKLEENKNSLGVMFYGMSTFH